MGECISLCPKMGENWKFNDPLDIGEAHSSPKSTSTSISIESGNILDKLDDW